MTRALAFLFAAAAPAGAAPADVAPAGAAPAINCPASHAVEAEIGRLGAARALGLTGTTDVAVAESSMRIVLRGHDGKVLGTREIAAPAACEERAAVAAVVIVAWLGEWSGGEPRAAPPRPPPAPPALPVVTAPRPAASTAARGSPLRAEVAAFAFGVHDGDAGTWGLGAQAGYGLGQRLSVIALGEGTGERVQPLGPGRAAYRTLRFGLGVALRHAMRRAFLDGGVAPEAVRLSLRGQGFTPARGATNWGLALDGRIRLGLRLAPVVPFVYADASYALTTARLTIDNRPDSVTLSRWGFAAGLGLLFSFGPLGG